MSQLVRGNTFGSWSGGRVTALSISSVDEAIARLSGELSPHRLTVTGSPRRLDARMEIADTFGQMHLSRLAYGVDAELSVDTASDHILVTVQTEGKSRVQSQGLEQSGGVGFVVVDSAPETVVKHFSEDSRRLNLKIPRVTVQNMWERTVGRPSPAPLVFHPFPSGPMVVQRWWAAVELLTAYATGEPGVLPRHAEVMTEAILLTLLTEFAHSDSSALHGPGHRGHRRLERAIEMMRERYAESLTLSGLAAETHMSIRSLTQQFREAYGKSPMQFLLEIRLQAAREKLAALQVERSVTTVAMDCGFSSMGRFAALYRARFGELPSQTAGR